MTPQEQQLLMQLTQRINQTQLQEKDPDAENLLGRELGANSDALYIMAQTVLVQNIALEQARAQVAQLQQQLAQARQQPAHATSFLGRLFGEHDEPQQQQAPRPPYPTQPQPPQSQQPPAWQPVPPYSQSAPPPQYMPPQYGSVPAGQPSFLRGAMQTAAGVAAGALAFEGVESILHGFGHGGGYGWGGPGIAGYGMGPGAGFGGGFERPVEETVINNYYDQPGSMGSGDQRVEHGLDHGIGQDFSGGEHHFEGAAPHFRDTGDASGAVYSDANYNTPADAGGAQDQGAADQGSYDAAAYGQGTSDVGGFDQSYDDNSVPADTSADDVRLDDSGSGFDDGSGFDSGGLDDGGGFDSGSGDGF